MYFYRKGRGHYRPGAARRAEGRARRHRAQAARGGAAGDLARRAGRRSPARRRSARPVARAAVPPRPQPHRIQGARRGRERAVARRRSGCCSRSARSRRPQALHRERFVFEQFPRGTAFPDVAPCPTDRRRCRRSPTSTAFSIDDVGDDRDRRRAVGHRDRRGRAGGARVAHRHPHRGAGPRDPPRRRDRRHRARPLLDRVLARREDHDAARRGRRGVHARGRSRVRRAVAVRRRDRRSRAGWRIVGSTSRIERVPIGDNLRHDRLDDVVTEETPRERRRRLSAEGAS